MIPYGKQNINEDDIQAVVKVLRSDFLTQGPVVPAFEAAVAEYCKAGFAVAVNSATSALHVACLALEVGPGDWVWTSPNTFAASANCALYCGAKVDFVDIDPATYNLDVACLTQKLAEAEELGRLPKVVIPVHFGGLSCDMAPIRELSRRYGFKIIEDASHGIGGRYRNRSIGCCEYSDITVFSFHPVKIITTGEGGMALTNDAGLAKRMARLRSHGITREPSEMTHAPDGPWYYQQIELGFNYRMTDVQAALGLSQLRRLDKFIERRHELAECYRQQLKGLPLTWQMENCHSALHLFVIRLQTEHCGISRLDLFNALRDAGIGVNVHYIPVHLQPYYRGLGFKLGDFPEAERYYRESITLPLFPDLTKNDIARVVGALAKCIHLP
ncbi:UDP-4-amino-4,6-dideoxy-N-acetyl-beta-L-altrosamine transaminase [Methylotuvimicrobium alcaliphilum]|uniref:Pyridoxal phosphate-dependent aminotransferase n=1 Tax=Methylotuvimicrobium alcaliphilum (strain DSM 19304 / NCIMB 14124 / VKM B-2133 / 20Z) TaxID=1091494 RepID=G4T1K3_META2|nr:UDP-4-amino-4,6-dideoxy-N-acetyl-beta-L-altrosamine transaminase [Methylotuvimicrobium alcaliphilum]CCE22425.1 putative pyridoxal phosphate-dependent aminotransferase [Methylotuvimicrobium alcaliphilum 20Z]